MNAILDTWGRHVEQAVIMSNTPNDLPIERLAKLDGSWRVHEAASLGRGRNRDPKESWTEVFQLLDTELRRDPGIRWIVRSDSDTWWNVARLIEKLGGNETILPSTEQSVMGQFFALVDFMWVREISAGAMKNNDLNRDKGRNAYLSGGAGLVFTRAAVETFVKCFHSLQTPTDHTVLEDVWLSRSAFECNVTLVRNDAMFQFGRVKRNKVRSSISIHRVAGDGRKDYRHPSYYEKQLKRPTTFLVDQRRV
jgi:hypothetical protein